MIKLTDGNGGTLWVAKSAIEMITPSNGTYGTWAKAVIQVSGVKQAVAETVSKVKELIDAG